MAAVAEVSGETAAAKNMDSTPKSESELNVQKLVDMFKKLNPLAKEFFPSSYSHHQSNNHYHNNGQLSPNYFPTANKPSSNDNFPNNRRVMNDHPRSISHCIFYHSCCFQFLSHGMNYGFCLILSFVWIVVVL